MNPTDSFRGVSSRIHNEFLSFRFERVETSSGWISRSDLRLNSNCKAKKNTPNDTLINRAFDVSSRPNGFSQRKVDESRFFFPPPILDLRRGLARPMDDKFLPPSRGRKSVIFNPEDEW